MQHDEEKVHVVINVSRRISWIILTTSKFSTLWTSCTSSSSSTIFKAIIRFTTCPIDNTNTTIIHFTIGFTVLTNEHSFSRCHSTTFTIASNLSAITITVATFLFSANTGKFTTTLLFSTTSSRNYATSTNN